MGTLAYANASQQSQFVGYGVVIYKHDKIYGGYSKANILSHKDSKIIEIESVIFALERCNPNEKTTIYNGLVEDSVLESIKKKRSNRLYIDCKNKYEKLMKQFNKNVELKRLELKACKTEVEQIHAKRYALADNLAREAMNMLIDEN